MHRGTTYFCMISKLIKKAFIKFLPESTSVNVIEVDRDNMYVGTTDGIIYFSFWRTLGGAVPFTGRRYL